MQLHVAALFAHNRHGDLVTINDPGRLPAPRFFMGITRDGAVRRFREDVDSDLRASLTGRSERYLSQLGAIDVVEHLAEYCALLAPMAPVQRTWAGPAFHTTIGHADPAGVVLVGDENVHLLRRHFEPWIPDVSTAQPVVAALLDGEAVALCCSVRKSPSAHEAGVETAAPYKRRGFATRAVTAWSAAVRASGATALYSTSWGNAASRALARKLDLRLFGTDLHVT